MVLLPSISYGVLDRFYCTWLPAALQMWINMHNYKLREMTVLDQIYIIGLVCNLKLELKTTGRVLKQTLILQSRMLDNMF